MNLRRGLQRVYIVLATTWVVAALIVVPSDRLRFWSAPDPNSSATAGASSVAGDEFSQYMVIGRPDSFVPDSLFSSKVNEARQKGLSDSEILAFVEQHPGVAGCIVVGDVNEHPAGTPSQPRSKFGGIPVDNGVNEHPAGTPSQPVRAAWLFGVLLALPLAGYAVLFLVVPWVYRGFKPGTRV